MYSNLTKTQGFPMAIRVSSKSKCFQGFNPTKPQSVPIGSHLKSSENVICTSFVSPSRNYGLSKFGGVVKPKSVFGGLHQRNDTESFTLVRAASFASFSSLSMAEPAERGRRGGRNLPWLASNKRNAANGMEKASAQGAKRSSWKEPAKGLENVNFTSSWEQAAENYEKGDNVGAGRSSWEESGKTFNVKNGSPAIRNRGSRSRTVDMVEEKRGDYDGEEDEGVEVVGDPKWDKIKNRFNRMGNVRGGSDSPQFRRWDKQESWGRKTWKEATESTVPNMVGEGIYGVGPVLAALSAGRREFYVLYLQQGLDLSSNNRKKKDKKGFEKVLKMAEKIGLSIREITKHDLNMLVDNRPHQGLVLDASPLEMVKIMELDPVSVEEDKGSLWIALDEITDPQNLGAIIRSAYFFGASGLVLCAKNSAPLSGVVSKASAGSLELMELRYCKNMMQFLTSSAENGWRVLGGSVSSRAIPLNEVPSGVPTVLVLGSEGTGLRPLVERSCTQLIKISGDIPVNVTARGVDDAELVDTNHRGKSEEFQSFFAVESLNVSVAAGVLIHHLIRNNHSSNSQAGDGTTILPE